MSVNSVSKLLKKRNEEGNIELDTFEKQKENTLVYGSNAKYWFKFDDGRVLFKEYENDLEAYGEVLYSKVADKYGIECAKYDFATYNNQRGTISYDVAYKNGLVALDGLVLFTRYNPDHLPDIIKRRSNNLEVLVMLNKKYNNYNELTKLFENRYPQDVEKLQKQLLKMFILDVLLDHVDKNLWNLLVTSDEYGNNPSLVAIDNSHIACLYRGEKYIKNAIDELLSGDGSITIEDYLRGGVYGYNVDVKEKNYSPARDLIDFYRESDESEREEIAEFIKKIEISEVLEDLNKKNRVDPIVNTWISAVFNYRKSFLLKKFYHINDDYKSTSNKKNLYLRSFKKNK